MKIIHAKVFTPEGVFVEKDVSIRGDRICGQGEENADGPVIDGAGALLIPGLIDIHFHGCAGHDFCEGTEEAFDAIAVYEASRGITSMVPATMTLPEEELAKICRMAAAYKNEKGAVLRGINLEGPFLSREKRGAQNDAYIIPPDAGFFRRLNRQAKGLIRLLAIAPELEGAMDVINELKEEVRLSAAHSTADYDLAMRAFAEGVSQVTHLYNAMTGMGHRNPGLAGAAADHESIAAELICDGIHVHPAVVRQTFKMFGDDRIILISDSMEAVGMPDGNYSLGGLFVEKKGRKACLKDGTIAGSVTDLMGCLVTAVKEMGIPLESAVKCASENPAKAVGIYEETGSITPGKRADLVLLDEKDLSIRTVILGGEIFLQKGEK